MFGHHCEGLVYIAPGLSLCNVQQSKAQFSDKTFPIQHATSQDSSHWPTFGKRLSRKAFRVSWRNADQVRCCLCPEFCSNVNRRQVEGVCGQLYETETICSQECNPCGFPQDCSYCQPYDNQYGCTCGPLGGNYCQYYC